MIYNIRSLESDGLRGDSLMVSNPAGTALWLWIDQGEALWTTGQASFPLRAGELLVLPASSVGIIQSLTPNTPAVLYQIHFDLPAPAVQAAAPDIFDRKDVRIVLSKQEMTVAKELYLLWKQGGKWDRLRAQGLFLRWAADLGERNEQTSDNDSVHKIYQTIRYIDENYQMPLDRRQLAEMSGLSPAYFTRLFKKTAGKSPMEYVLDVRIRQAQRQLLRQPSTVQDIAENVGYANPFHFSRTFKKATGVSPTVYIQQNQSKIRVAALNNQYTGILLTLGLEPCAATGMAFRRHSALLRNTVSLDQHEGRLPDLKLLYRTEPDLIVGSEFTGKDNAGQLSQVAPFHTIPFEAADWRNQLAKIAELVDRRTQAEDWLAAYERQACKVAGEWKSRLGGSVVMALLVREQDYLVAGYRHVGAVMYEDLNLLPPDAVRNAGAPIMVRKDDDKLLGMLDADYIFAGYDLALSPERKQEWLNSAWWNSREAVKRRRYYCTESSYVWGSYNSFSHQLLLDKMEQYPMSL